MRNINNPEDTKSIQDRISKLTSGSKGQWGKMIVNQMLRHLSDALRMQSGEIEVKDTGNFFTHTVFKWVSLCGAPVPKNVPTFPPIDQVARGVNPEDLQKEVDKLNTLIQRSLEPVESYYHPLFGKLSNSQRGRINYIHMNHHLKQFGV
jgi:hypothetical protein